MASRLMRIDEYPRLLTEFTASLFALPDNGNGQSLREFALEQLNSRARQAKRMARQHSNLSADERHRMRLAFKKLRYTLEFFSSLLPSHRLGAYLAALAQLQDELGLINDHVTAAELMQKILGNRYRGPIQGWIAGRHALLVRQLPETLNTWLAQQTPWKGR